MAVTNKGASKNEHLHHICSQIANTMLRDVAQYNQNQDIMGMTLLINRLGKVQMERFHSGP